MTGEHLNAQARRVVAGLDADGKSTIISDENTTARVAAPTFTVMNLWQVDQLPVHVDDEDGLGQVTLMPPMGSLIYRIASFPPDSEWDSADYQKSLSALESGDSHDTDSEIAGLHQTDSIDLITMLSGELYAVLETTETLLRPGDTFVQRGGKHSWSNRGNIPATYVACTIPAKR
ncbi:cupin domain-containing protein [Rhodococcus sp. WS1]|uniref:cupin domain-containing protein n=1 Tax=unclassified Rhodococcus (in: high G+C Gram-positive bacteria) TaxID=192944 RepID=UPI00114116EB|nr:MULTISPECIES: cupin domain-containing protein [unclassified Rhodococcus (in: high G+C Gram-positive bacteria)]ROZ52923.1 cupin domain-containing protein [Rhodococcus sp. WS1]TQC36015.1 cupin domain-containing protein [Rhodococcus sp. WS7]